MLTEPKRISGLDLDDVPGACDENFYHFDKRISMLESDFSHVKEWCEESKESLKNIEKSINELTGCVKPRLAEFGAKIENLESQAEKSNNGNGNGFPSKKTIILIILTAAVVGTGGEKIINLLLKAMGVN